MLKSTLNKSKIKIKEQLNKAAETVSVTDIKKFSGVIKLTIDPVKWQKEIRGGRG